MRKIITALRIAIDLERIGDLAGNIAKGAIAIANEPHPKQAVHGFVHIGEIALRQLKDALDAYSQRDAGKALKAWEQEQQVDAMYNSLYRELLAATMDEPRNAGLYAQLLFGAKNLERGWRSRYKYRGNNLLSYQRNGNCRRAPGPHWYELYSFRAV